MSKKDWYIIEAGKMVTGPFTTEEVQGAIASLPSKTQLIKNGVEPIHVQDEIGFQQIVEFGHLLESDNHPVSVLPTPVSRVLSEPVSPEYIVVATRNLSSKETAPKSKQTDTHQPRLFDRLRQLLQRNRSLLLLLALGASALWPKPIELDGHAPNDRKFSALALEDNPTQVMNALISAKLARKDIAYTYLLLKLQSMKDSFPASEIPSTAWTAALALTSIPREELDQSPPWKMILKELNAKKRIPPLAAMGYEFSRINELTISYTRIAQKLGVSEELAYLASPTSGFPLLWGAKTQKIGGSAIPFAALDEAWISLKRIADSFDNTLPQERILRDRIVARTLWNSLTLILFSPKSLPQKAIEAKLDFAERLSEKLPGTDQIILKRITKETREQFSNKTDAVKIAIARENTLSDLQRDYRIFCRPENSAIATDFILQTMALQEKIGRNKGVITRQIFDECLVGSSSFLRAAPKEHKLIAGTSLYLPAQTPSDLALRTWGRAKKANKSDSILSPEPLSELWKFYTKIANHLPMSVKEKAQIFCKSEPEDNAFCLNFYWHTTTSPIVNAKILPTIAKTFSSIDASAAALTLAVNLEIESDKGASIPPETRAEILTQARTFINDVEDDTSALDWYGANRFAIKR